MNPYRQPTHASVLVFAHSMAGRVAAVWGTHGARRLRQPLGVGIAMLLLLSLVWQPTTAVGAPMPPGSPMASSRSTVHFANNVNHVGSIRSADATMAVSATTTSITSDSPDPSTVNQSYTVAATVATAVGSPTGTVTVDDGTGQSCAFTVPPLSGSCALTSITAGGKTLTASYGGDSTFFGSSGTAGHTVNKANTSVSLSSSLNPAERTVSVLFTATITEIPSGAANPSGNVNFFDGVNLIGTGVVAGNVASFSTSSLSVGTHSITAQYVGDANFNGSTSSAVSQVITKSPTSTSLTATPNPSLYGQYVTLQATVTNTGAGTGSPGNEFGLVTFKDGTIPIGSGILDGSGVASIAICNLTVGTHSITAVYGGSVSFLGSTSSAVSQVVNKDTTVTTASSSQNPSLFGELITLSASVVGTSPCSGLPTGTVTFKNGATNLSTQSLLSGSASFLFNSLPVGSHNITAVYSGDASHETSTSAILVQVVNKDPTTTVLSTTPNPAVYGQNLSLSAAVSANAPGNGFPSGTVTFKNISLGTTLCITSGLSWSCPVTLPVGTHNLRADYGGDASFLASNSALVSQVVNKSDTTTILADAVNPTVFGQTTTFTATVAATAPGAGNRTGVVSFYDNGTLLVTSTLGANFKAAFSTSALAVGTHPITATYSGDSNFNPSSTAVVNHVVNKANTTTAVVSAPNPSTLSQLVTITATVTGNAPATGAISPTGTVTFKDGPSTIGTGSLSGGVATMTTSSFVLGSHLLTVVYPGDGNFNGSTSAPYNHAVGVASTTTSLAQDSTTTIYGQNVGLTATVTSTGGTPPGVVSFLDGGSAIGSNTLAGGTTTLNTTALTAGTHTLTAVYNGDPNFNASASGPITHTVNKANTTTSVVSSVNPTVFGQSTTFTAQVNPVAPGAGTRTGTVDFKDGVSTIGSAAVDAAGQATFSIATLAVGGHSITAVYNGDTNFNGSTGSLPTQTVNPASTTTTISSDSNPSASGASVTFTANVTVNPPGAGAPTGTVQFKDGLSNLGGPVALAGGSASVSTSSLSVGSHNITAVYSGDGSFNGSTSAILVQVVTTVLPTADFSVVKTDSPDPVRAGDNVTYLISVTNNSVGGGTVTMTDTLPSQVGLISTSAPGWSCSVPVGKVVCTKTVGAGATDVITVIVNVPGTLAAGTVLINTAAVAGGGGTVDPNTNNDTSTAQTTVYRTRRFAVAYE